MKPSTKLEELRAELIPALVWMEDTIIAALAFCTSGGMSNFQLNDWIVSSEWPQALQLVRYRWSETFGLVIRGLLDCEAIQVSSQGRYELARVEASP